MKNITLSASEEVIAKAREAARKRGVSLNALVREYLVHLAGEGSNESEFERLRELSRQARGQRHGWVFDRDEVHRR